MRLKLILFASIFLASIGAKSQWTDLGAWTSASVSGELKKKQLDYSVSAASRWDMDVTRHSLAFVSAEMGYKFADDWSTSADLRLGSSRTDEYAWETVQRVSADVKWKHKLNKKFDLGFRLKGQTGFKGPLPSIAQTTFSKALRIRPSVYYDLPKGRSIITSVEFFMRHNDARYSWSDTRLRISMKDKVAKRKFVTISYLFEKEREGPDPWAYHVIAIDFSMKKKRKTVDK